MLLFLFFSVVVVHGTVEDAERFEIEVKHLELNTHYSSISIYLPGKCVDTIYIEVEEPKMIEAVNDIM